MYRDSVGNTYRSLPPRKPNPGAKGTTNGFRGDREKRKKRYAAQYAKTVANVIRRLERHLAVAADALARPRKTAR